MVVGFLGLALMSASNGTPYVRAMIAGVSPVFTRYSIFVVSYELRS
jgi:hypothetical protein